jgi:uncharacterized membrane protein
MSLPALILGLVIASLYGALYHLVRDGGFWRLVLYLILSWLGFAAGHFLATWLGWVFLPIGDLNLGAAMTGGLVFLGVGDWLSRIEIKRQSKV